MASWWHKLEQWLLWVDVPGDAGLVGVEGGVRHTWAVVLTLFCVALAAAGIVALYLFEAQRMSLWRRLFLAAVRTAVVGVLFFLLFRPLQFVAVFKGERPRGVVLLIDNSQSMTQKDRRISPADRVRVAIAGGRLPFDADLRDLTKLQSDVPDRPSRLDLVRDVLQNPKLDLRNNLDKFGPTRTFLFGTKLRRVVDEPGQDTLREALNGQDPETKLADGINDVLQRPDGDLPAAVVVMTDGGDNASEARLINVARECKQMGVPLHIYGVGSAEAGTLQLREVGAPEFLFADDPVAVPVRWKALGMKGGTVELTVTLGGEQVARKEVAARDGDDLRETLTFTPPKGKSKDETLDLVTTVRLKGNKEFTDSIKKPARLIDRKIKLLYVEGAPRWEYKFLQMNLLRDRRVEPSYLLLHGDEKTLNSGPPFLPAFPASRKELFLYNLLVIGDVPASYFGTEKMQWIADFVKEGGGLIFVAGRQHAPSSWTGTPLASMLPIEFEPTRFNSASEVRPQVYQPVLTPAGERHELMSLADTHEENTKVWRDLPGLYWHYPVSKLRPGAIALLDHPFEKCKNDDRPMPLVALQYYGRGLVICLTIEETWRWRFNTQEKLFARFWGQAIYLAGMTHMVGTKQTQIALDRSEIVTGRDLNVYVRMYDAGFKPLAQEKGVEAVLEHLDGKGEPGQSVRLTPTGQPGEFTAPLPNDRVGRFALRIPSTGLQGSGGGGTLEYRVTLPPKHELAVAGLAKESLEEAAAASGGKFYREEDLGKLVGNIVPQSAPFTVRQPVMPLNPLAFILFAALITLEWVVRKFSNLS
jgi:hypothetical protein